MADTDIRRREPRETVPQELLLVVDGLTKSFGALEVTRDVSFSVKAGEILGVIGPNGAGKTTLFNLLTGFLAPDSGRIRFGDRDIGGMRVHRIAALGLQRTFQSSRPLHSETVLDNVVAGTHLRGKGGLLHSLLTTPSAQAEERRHYAEAMRLLDRVGLSDIAGYLPAQLSAGQLRLLEIVRALAGGPRLLLLDEPAAGLNQAETSALEAMLRTVRDDGTTFVVVEHDVELVLRLCDRVMVLNDGAVLLTGPPDEVRHDARVAEAYLGRADQAGGAE